MGWLLFRSILAGIGGAILVPILTFVGVLVLAHTFDPRCGTPGDSGGCEMGAASIAIASALPGAAIAFAVVLVLGLRKRSRSVEPPEQP